MRTSVEPSSLPTAAHLVYESITSTKKCQSESRRVLRCGRSALRISSVGEFVNLCVPSVFPEFPRVA